MQTKILGLSGKKQSGKDTTANWLIGLFMQQTEIVEKFIIQPDGKLWITDIFQDTSRAGIYDIRSDINQAFNHEFIYPFVKIYSYADELKKLCINVLGLAYKQCYGTDAEKDSLTDLLWENMPGITTVDVFSHGYADISHKTFGIIQHTPGFMTGREVMQYVGTEIFRKMYGNVWVDATFRKIKTDSPTMAIISDVRFANEVEGTQDRDGKVIRLLRTTSTDQHESEKALDDYVGFDCIVPKDVTIEEQNRCIATYLNSIGWLPRPISEYLIE